MLNYHHWDKRIFILFGVPSIGGTLIGVALIEYTNPHLLKIILAIVLILFALYSLWKPSFQIQATPLIGRIGGALSGFTAGLIGT
jgi:uncharacterized protein